MEEQNFYAKLTVLFSRYAHRDQRASAEVLMPETVLFGREGMLDSMSIVSFIMEVEDHFSCKLLDEAMLMSQRSGVLKASDLEQLLKREKKN